MKASVLGLDGKQVREVQLPAQFEETYRPDVIKRAVLAEATQTLQPKGNFPLAGIQTTAEYYGRRHAWRQTINTGRSRLPREKIAKGRSGRVLMVPHAVKGRRAHPPSVMKKLLEKINPKENNLALRSAIASTASQELVKARGHAFNGHKLPVVVDDSIQSLKKTSEVEKVFTALGLEKDVERARDGTSRRSGVSRLRRGGRMVPRSVLVVISKDDGISKAARNLPGVQVVEVKKITPKLLAPGGSAGRLVAWSEGAIGVLAKEKVFY